MNSKLLALILVAVLGSVPISADEFFPSEEPIDAALRLESIKASLLDYALDHSVYVSTQAWLDGNGAVEEKVLLLSGLNLERVRVNEYRNVFGVAEAAIIEAPTTAAESWYGCPVTSPVKRRVALISHIDQTGSVAARNIAVAAQRHVMQHLTSSQSLLSAADPFVREPVTGSVYARYMQRPVAKKADLAVRINIAVQQLASRSVLAPSLRNAGNALTIQLVVTELDEVIYEVEFAARLPKAALTAAMPEISQDLLRQLDASLAEVAMQLSDQIRCRASSKLNVVRERGQLRVDGGEDLGVFSGQEFLLVPSSRGFASRGLDAAIKSIAIAQVERVGHQDASLRVVAGALPSAIGVEMIAVPLASMDFM